VAKVYLSSTIADLTEERRAVLDWMRLARHQVVDSYLPDGDTVRDSCLADIAECDLYVLILGHRYGFQPPDDNPEGLSITQLEFRRAGQCGIPRVALLRTSIPDVSLSDLQDPARAPLVLGFRDEVAREVRPAQFSDLKGLIEGLSMRVQAELDRQAKRFQQPTGPAAGLVLRLEPRPMFLAGREDLLGELDGRLAGDAQTGPRMVALCGLGGAGKTSLALEYAHRHLGEVRMAWQLPADEPAVLVAGFGELAAQLGAREIVDARDPVATVHGALAASPEPWLLVFDNASDWDSVVQFMPPAGPGRVLITSRGQTWPPGQALEVPVLDPQSAAEFLLSRTGDADRHAALELARELGGLPLTLEQAAAYVQASGTSLAAYLALFRKRRADQLGRGEPTGYPILDESPGVEADVRAVVEEIAAQVPDAVAAAADHTGTAARNVNVIATGDGTTAEHPWEHVAPIPYSAGSREYLAGPAILEGRAPDSVAAGQGGTGQFVLLNDQPVSELDSEDILGITSEVSGLANLIMGSRYKAPFTVGIDADWGMGKSTLMLQLQAALDARKTEGVVTKWFNAWTAQEDDALAGLIKSALTEIDKSALRRLLHRVTKHRSFLTGIRVMFIVVASFLHLGSVVDQLWEFMSIDARSRNEIVKDLGEVFKDWAGETTQSPHGRLLVVFVDDLDRCSNEVIIRVCEAIRLYLAVPGVVFVIGCDQEVLTRAAKRSGMDSEAATSLGFLEKIIQITYRKPAPDEEQIRSLVKHYADSSRAGGLFSEQAQQIVMQGTGRNPRRMKRLLNSIILQYRLKPEWESLGPENLSAVILLGHFYQEFYRELTRPNDINLIHKFLQYKELRDRVQRGDPLRDQDRLFFTDNNAVAPTADDTALGEAISFLETKLPSSFPGLAGKQEFVQLLSELAEHPKFEQLIDWLQRRAPAKAAEFVVSPEEISLNVGMPVPTMGTLRNLPGQEQAPVRLAPRPVFLAGREDLLGELDARLTAPGDGPRIAVLYGLGGVGKTSVAVEYAHRHLGEVGVAWQLPADEPAVLVAGFGELAAQLGAREIVDARDPVATVHGVLAASTLPWLLVFDNAADRASVAQLVPPAGPGRVLITSRNQIWPPGQALEVPVLDAGMGAGFLVNRTGDTDSQAALELARELGGLPLALEQAAAYVQASGRSLAEYLRLFQARRPEMLSRGDPTGYSGRVATSWSLAFGHLQDAAPGAAGLLRLLAFYAPEAIPLNLLLQPRPALAGRLSAETAPVLMPLLEDELATGEAIGALRRYSLVTPAEGGSVSVHRLVQTIIADQMPAELARQWQHAAAVLIETAIPDDPELPRTWPTYAALLPHAEAVLDPTSDGIWHIALYLGYSGSYRAARDLFALIADADMDYEAYGPEHPSTLAARRELARWTGEAGDAAAACDLLAALLPVEERVLGPEHPNTLAVRASLARWTGEAGDAAAARDQFAALLHVRERVLGPEHPDTLTVRASLAQWTEQASAAPRARSSVP